MADVPVWVLVVQTLAAGGFGLAGSFIVPAAQRASRRSDAKARSNAIMREKAELIFAELAAVRRLGNAASDEIVDVLLQKRDDRGGYNMSLFRAFDAASGLIGTYYPDGLALISEGRAKMRLQTDPLHEQLTACAAGPMSDEGLALRTRMTMAISAWNVDIADSLDRFMIKAVRPYHPSAEADV